MRVRTLTLVFGASVLVGGAGLLTFPQVQEALAAQGLPSAAPRSPAAPLASVIDLRDAFVPAAAESEEPPAPADVEGGLEAEVEAAAAAGTGSDAEVEPAPAPPPPRGPTLWIERKAVWVYAAASAKARKLGYLRAGATVTREPKPAGYSGCPKGFYRIAPRGYVCASHGAALEPDERLAKVLKEPDRTEGLPYAYAMSRFPTPPLYVKLPSKREQSSVEGDLTKLRDASGTWELTAPPEGLTEGLLPSLGPTPRGASLYLARAFAKSGFALLTTFDWEGRPFGLTTDFLAIPLDRTRKIVPSAFHGVDVSDVGLPAVFVRSKSARFYVRDEKTGQMTDAGPVAYREGLRLSGKRERAGGGEFLETREGRWIQAGEHLVRIDEPREWPSFAEAGAKWIDVSILKQSLVAWEGKRPVYVTLVSTGADGLGDPAETHSTVRGSFLIHTKHVTVTMDNDEDGDRFDLRDVPYVQYFHEGYAIHAAYWHDDFGRPKSHGCINLHPTDAAWLFGWTTPEVPEGWHAAMSLRTGTTITIHP